MNVLTIPSRFNGPAGVGNGGYVCGRIAAYVDGPATVTLRRPPPLDTPMEVERDGDGSVRVRHGRTLIGEAAPSPAGPISIVRSSPMSILWVALRTPCQMSASGSPCFRAGSPIRM